MDEGVRVCGLVVWLINLVSLEFCVPPTDEYIEELVNEKPRKR